MDENLDPENEILKYIDKHGIEHKDQLSISSKPKNKSSKRVTIFKTKGSYKKVVDLHGRTQEQAIPILRSAFETCKKDGIKNILIIHGIGYNSDPNEGPVLKHMVRQMLEYELALYVLDYKRAVPKDGGDGATLVRLR